MIRSRETIEKPLLSWQGQERFRSDSSTISAQRRSLKKYTSLLFCKSSSSLEKHDSPSRARNENTCLSSHPYNDTIHSFNLTDQTDKENQTRPSHNVSSITIFAKNHPRHSRKEVLLEKSTDFRRGSGGIKNYGLSNPVDSHNNHRRKSALCRDISSQPARAAKNSEVEEMLKELRALTRSAKIHKDHDEDVTFKTSPVKPKGVRELKRRSRRVTFSQPLVTSIMHRPYTNPEDLSNLFFDQDELDVLEAERLSQISEEQIECVATKIRDDFLVSVSFPRRHSRSYLNQKCYRKAGVLNQPSTKTEI